MSFFNNLTIFFSILISAYLTFIDAAVFNITNNCSERILAAASLGGAAMAGGGRELYPGQNWVYNTDQGASGRIWARTNCDGNKCESGDCGGVLVCETIGAPPVTLVEFTIGVNQDFLDISLVDGFNVPVELSSMTSGCTIRVKCTADINRLCPTELRDPGGCLHPCTVFNNDQFCCVGTNSTPSTCGPTPYSKFFKDACPNAYSYAYDDITKAFTCPTGTDYKVVFCP